MHMPLPIKSKLLFRFCDNIKQSYVLQNNEQTYFIVSSLAQSLKALTLYCAQTLVFHVRFKQLFDKPGVGSPYINSNLSFSLEYVILILIFLWI